MVIIGLTPGLANEMYQYATAYALSKEIKQELVLDITACVNSGFGGYLLDFFSIPTTTKLLYFIQDSEQSGLRVPEQLREQVTVLTQEIQNDTMEYKSLDELVQQKPHGNIYLSGFFFDREKYFDKYWNEIKQLFSLNVKIREVDIFQALIQDKVSVGLHIRRGDMLLEKWAEKMEDDYYKAAIEYCRKNLDKDGKQCSFFVFSDDIAYAKKLLGKDNSIWYVNWGGVTRQVLRSLYVFRYVSTGYYQIVQHSVSWQMN